jgi:hypothetical protein
LFVARGFERRLRERDPRLRGVQCADQIGHSKTRRRRRR